MAVSFSYLQSVVTDDTCRLTRWLDHDAGQMFNLRQDPLEQNNLSNHPEYQFTRIWLLERLITVGFRPYLIKQYPLAP